MNTYDEGYLREETSLYTRSKLEPDDKTKVFSEADKEKYLETLRAKYPNIKSLEEQYAEAKLVPDKDREHFFNEEVHDKYVSPNLNSKEIEELAKKFNVSKKKIEKNQTQYVYYDFLDKNNRVFKDKKEFKKFQNELKEKIKNEKDPKKREELNKIGTRYFWDYIFREYSKVKGKIDINTYKNYIKLYGVKNNE